jgi:soluble lytic murein transglycosylase
VYLQHTEPAWWARIWYPLRYSSIVRTHAHNYDLNPALLAAVIDEESKFRADAKSSAGAVGLMQLLPATAKGIAIHTGGSKFVTSDLYNPEINVRYGAWYLHHLLQKYGDERLALAAYNAGQQNVDTWRSEGKGVQFPETRAYIDEVERLKDIYRRTYSRELGLSG